MMSENDWHAHRAEALDLILEATLRPEAWNDFISHVCKVVGATSGAMAIRSSKPMLELIDPVAATWPDEAVEAYLSHPREQDPVIVDLTMGMFALRNGKSFITQELLDDRAYRQTPFFNDFASKFDIAYLTGVSVDVGSDHFGTLMIYREDGSSIFGQHERRFLESLVKPLRIGLETRRRLKGTTVAHGLLARLAIPVVTLDERGRVDYSNQTAEQLFQRGGIVSIHGGRLRTNRPDTTHKLQTLCLDAVRGDIPPHGQELFLERPDGAPALRLLFLPLSHQLSDSLWGGEVPAAIFFFDAQEEPTPPDVCPILRQTFGCSEAEATVAVLYAQGLTRTEIAGQCRKSSETVKDQLRDVFRKTGVKNKAELVALIQKLGSPLR